MISEEDTQENQVFELVRILHKTKLTFYHEYNSQDGYQFNSNLLAKYFDPHNCHSYESAYWILKTMSFKSCVPLPYDKLLKICLMIPTTKTVEEFGICQKYLMKMMTLCVRKVFKLKVRNSDFFARFDIACQKLTTELIGFYDSETCHQLTHDSFNLKSALDEIDSNLYSEEENIDYPLKIGEENIRFGSNELEEFPFIQTLYLREVLILLDQLYAFQLLDSYCQCRYIYFIKPIANILIDFLIIQKDLIIFLNKYFRGKVEKASDGTAKGIDCLRKIINLIYQKTKDFSKEIVIMQNDPLINVVNLLNYLNELKVLDQICLDEAALAIQKCILIITKDTYDKNFFEQNQFGVSEQLFLNVNQFLIIDPLFQNNFNKKKIKIMTTFLTEQKKKINLNCGNLLFFITCLNDIEDSQIEQELFQSILKYDEGFDDIKYLIKGMQGTLSLKDVEDIIEHFNTFQGFPINDEVFVNFLINAKYTIEGENNKDKLIKLYRKEFLEKLAQSRPYALKFLFLLCFKLEQEVILSLREEKNIFFDIISILELNNHTDCITSILKTMLTHLDYIFKNKQGLYEESVAGMYEYIEQCNTKIHEIKEEWEQLDEGSRMRRIIEFTETYNLFNMILLYPLEIERIQNNLLNLRKKEIVNCFYTRLPYCCEICGKKTKEYSYLFNSIKRPNITCSNCERNIPIYILRCNFKIEISQEMRSYIHNTALTFSKTFCDQINSLKKIAIKNGQDIQSLNSICTEFEPLILLHFQHLQSQIKFDFD